MKLTISAFNKIFQIRLFGKPKLPISGYTSRTEDGFHVLFLDYDMVSPQIVYSDAQILAEEGYISHAIIFSTYETTDELGTVGNYHVVCIDKMTFSTVLEAMKLTHCDTYHRDLAKNTRYRSWVLRFTKKGRREKPRLVTMIVYEEASSVEQSEAHLRLLMLLHPELRSYVNNWNWCLDGETKTVITHYNTLKERSEAK